MRTAQRIAVLVALMAGVCVAGGHAEDLTVLLPGDVPLELIWIDPGSFTMGTTDSQKEFMDSLRSRETPTRGIVRYSDTELPAHQVGISQGFYMGKFEITQAQWSALMDTSPWEGLSARRIGHQKPVQSVSWIDAQAFITRLNEVTGDSLYRLPTEAEWEYSCKAGTETLWFTGNEPESTIGHIAPERGPHDVGSGSPNPFSLFDMMGNVEEWVLEGTREYSDLPVVDPKGPIPSGEVGASRTRGGASSHPAYDGEQLLWFSRCGYRSRFSAGVSYNESSWVGFRVMRSAGSPTSVEQSTWGQMKRGN